MDNKILIVHPARGCGKARMMWAAIEDYLESHPNTHVVKYKHSYMLMDDEQYNRHLKYGYLLNKRKEDANGTKV